MPKRYYRIVAEEKSSVFFLDVAKFFYFFSDAEIKRMASQILRIPKADIEEKVRMNLDVKQLNRHAMLNAMKFNQVASYES